MNSTQLAVRQSACSESANQEKHRHGDVHISGNAIVQLGDRYGPNKDLFEAGSEAEKRNALLNVLYYDDFNLKRDQLALTDIGPKSFSWVEQTGLPVWLSSNGTRFWINGKPGSGKSTLMKHIADSRSTIDRLSTNGKRWSVVHFFFDYRAGKTMANQILGMLKLFLRQLTLSVKHIKEQLQEPAFQQALSGDKLEDYLDVISTVLVASDVPVCAFIDGLDEYGDNLWDLCSSLDELQNRTGMKMCLASRPERAFEHTFSDCPSITMQEHNTTSMEIYMHRKIEKFLSQHPFAEDLFSPELLTTLVEKAQGVIFTTTTELLAFLEALPTELELLYERILEKINQAYQNEAAVVLQILIENGATMKAATFFQTWDYLNASILHLRKAPNAITFSAYEARAKALLGNLIDLVRSSKRPVSIRLIHRSLSTYLTRSNWVTPRLPNAIVEAWSYPDSICKHLAFTCINEISQRDVIDVTELETLLEKLARSDNTKYHWPNRKPSATGSTFKQQWIICTPWSKWTDLLLHSIDGFFDTGSNDLQGFALQLEKDGWPTGGQNLALLHYMRCSKCTSWTQEYRYWHAVSRLYRAGALDILLLIMHGKHDAVTYQITHRSSELTQLLMEDLLDACFYQEERRRMTGKRDMTLLSWFAEHNHLVGPRHLCCLAIRKVRQLRPEFYALIREIGQRDTTGQMSHHHHDCPRKHESVHMIIWASPLLESHLKTNVKLGIDINQPYDSNGSSLFHALLEYAEDRMAHATTLRDNFIALVRAGVKPNAEGGRTDFLVCAKTSLEKAPRYEIEYCTDLNIARDLGLYFCPGEVKLPLRTLRGFLALWCGPLNTTKITTHIGQTSISICPMNRCFLYIVAARREAKMPKRMRKQAPSVQTEYYKIRSWDLFSGMSS